MLELAKEWGLHIHDGLAWLVEPQGLWLGLGLGLLPVSMVPLFLGTYRQWKTIHLVPRRLT